MTKKILFLTRNAIISTTNAGNTLHNLFGFCKKEDTANLYCREETPDIDMCQSYYCISENKLIKTFFNNTPIGDVLDLATVNSCSVSEQVERKRYDLLKKHRLTVLLWIRESVWFFSKRKWDNANLWNFVEDFSPDIIYMPLYDCFYMHRILYLVAGKTKAKLLTYSGDDFYSYNRYRLSPLYYINQFMLRHFIKKTVEMSSAVICLSKTETNMLKDRFGNKVKQVYKSYDANPVTFSKVFYEKDILSIVYGGNLAYGRWKTLLMVGKAVDKVNVEGRKYSIDVYTATQLSRRQARLLGSCDSINLHGEVSYSKLMELQRNANILLNIESFDRRDIEAVKMSFSTKIVDYLFCNTAILSFGPTGVNSIDYLVDSNLTLYASTVSELIDLLLELHGNQIQIIDLARKAYAYGMEHHDSRKAAERLISILDKL